MLSFPLYYLLAFLGGSEGREFGGIPQAHAAFSKRFPSSNYETPLVRLRGGSTQTATTQAPSSSQETDANVLRQYQMQQQLLLQSRSIMLRQALIDRGLTALQFTTEESKVAKPTDWDCAMASPEHPKSCLYSFDAEQGAKVVAPRDTTQWITLAALNRLRRTDPSKVEPLWHDQYSILPTWFHPTQSPYSLYAYLSPRAALVSFVLDAPLALGLAMAALFTFAFLLTFPFWEALATHFLTSGFFWMSWPQWGRFVHAAFPLKLLLGQMAWKAIASVLGRIYGRVRSYLIELECQLWEQCIPRTIVEDAENDNKEDDDSDADGDDDDVVDLR